MGLTRILCKNLLSGQISRFHLVKIASVSTSKKNKDTIAFPQDLFPKQSPPPPKTVEDFAETKNPKSWVSYGFNEDNYEEDRHLRKHTCFWLYTILFCGGAFQIAYSPDNSEMDWAMREGRLLLHYREKNGLPLIDKNYMDPARIELPSDEELGDTEIII